MSLSTVLRIAWIRYASGGRVVYRGSHRFMSSYEAKEIAALWQNAALPDTGVVGTIATDQSASHAHSRTYQVRAAAHASLLNTSDAQPEMPVPSASAPSAADDANELEQDEEAVVAGTTAPVAECVKDTGSPATAHHPTKGWWTQGRDADAAHVVPGSVIKLLTDHKDKVRVSSVDTALHPGAAARAVIRNSPIDGTGHDSEPGDSIGSRGSDTGSFSYDNITHQQKLDDDIDTVSGSSAVVMDEPSLARALNRSDGRDAADASLSDHAVSVIQSLEQPQSGAGADGLGDSRDPDSAHDTVHRLRLLLVGDHLSELCEAVQALEGSMQRPASQDESGMLQFPSDGKYSFSKHWKTAMNVMHACGASLELRKHAMRMIRKSLPHLVAPPALVLPDVPADEAAKNIAALRAAYHSELQPAAGVRIGRALQLWRCLIMLDILPASYTAALAAKLVHCAAHSSTPPASASAAIRAAGGLPNDKPQAAASLETESTRSRVYRDLMAFLVTHRTALCGSSVQGLLESSVEFYIRLGSVDSACRCLDIVPPGTRTLGSMQAACVAELMAHRRLAKAGTLLLRPGASSRSFGAFLAGFDLWIVDLIRQLHRIPSWTSEVDARFASAAAEVGAGADSSVAANATPIRWPKWPWPSNMSEEVFSPVFWRRSGTSLGRDSDAAEQSIGFEAGPPGLTDLADRVRPPPLKCVVALLQRMVALDVTITPVIFALAASIFGRLGDPDTVHSLIKVLPSLMQQERAGLLGYNQLLAALRLNTSVFRDPSGKVMQTAANLQRVHMIYNFACNVLSGLKTQGPVPSIVTYNHVLRIAIELSPDTAVNTSVMFLQQIITDGVVPNNSTYDLLMQCFANHGRAGVIRPFVTLLASRNLLTSNELCERLLQSLLPPLTPSMAKAGLSVTSASDVISAAALTLPTLGALATEALLLFDHMIRRNLMISDTCWIYAFESAFRTENAGRFRMLVETLRSQRTSQAGSLEVSLEVLNNAVRVAQGLNLLDMLPKLRNDLAALSQNAQLVHPVTSGITEGAGIDALAARSSGGDEVDATQPTGTPTLTVPPAHASLGPGQAFEMQQDGGPFTITFRLPSEPATARLRRIGNTRVTRPRAPSATRVRVETVPDSAAVKKIGRRSAKGDSSALSQLKQG